MEQSFEESGYIYCLSNESYKDTYKIGFTKNDPLARMVQLNTTGLLYPFKLEFAKQVKNYQEKEKKLHNIFDKYRVNKNREFFKIELKEIKQLFDLIDGKWYKPNSPNKEPTKLKQQYSLVQCIEGDIQVKKQTSNFDTKIKLKKPEEVKPRFTKTIQVKKQTSNFDTKIKLKTPEEVKPRFTKTIQVKKQTTNLDTKKLLKEAKT
jgi:hypothetical protein